MRDVCQTSMIDLYSTTSFGGGGGSGGSGGGGRATLGPGGGSDPGNHQSARTGNGLGTGPLSSRQHNAVTGALIGATLSPVGSVGRAAGALGVAASRGYASPGLNPDNRGR